MPRPPAREHLSRAAWGLLVVVAAGVSVSAGQREPYETASPFVGLYQLADVHTSNDEYSVWLSWPATTARLVVGPWRWGVDVASADTGRPWVEVHCRADGGQPLGYSGPLPWGASLVIPLILTSRTCRTCGTRCIGGAPPRGGSLNGRRSRSSSTAHARRVSWSATRLITVLRGRISNTRRSVQADGL